MAQVGMHEAKTTLSRLVERAVSGKEIVIARRGTPVARLVPVTAGSSLASVRGAWRGRVRLADDFDELPDEIADGLRRPVKLLLDTHAALWWLSDETSASAARRPS